MRDGGRYACVHEERVAGKVSEASVDSLEQDRSNLIRVSGRTACETGLDFTLGDRFGERFDDLGAVVPPVEHGDDAGGQLAVESNSSMEQVCHLRPSVRSLIAGYCARRRSLSDLPGKRRGATMQFNQSHGEPFHEG